MFSYEQYNIHMVELMILNQVIDSRMTFDWNEIWKFWILFWNPLIEIYIYIYIKWNNKALITSIVFIFWKNRNIYLFFVWGNIWFKSLAPRYYIKILITYWKPLCKTETFVLIRISFLFLFFVLSIISKFHNILKEFWNFIFENYYVIPKSDQDEMRGLITLFSYFFII